MAILCGVIVTDDINKIFDVFAANHICNGIQFSISPEMIESHAHKLTEMSIQKHIESRLFLVEHSKYVYNFCRQNVANQIESLIKEVQVASLLGCNVVIHQGKNVKSEKISKLEAISNYVRNLSEVIEQTYDSDALLLLENSSAQGSELGYTLDELAYIYHQFDESVKERIGFCLDTCHIFVAGELDVRNISAVTEFFKKFDQVIGLDHLKCIHFNDSGIPFKGKRDLHGDFYGGYITNQLLGGSIEGMRYIAKFAAHRHIPLIFETPCLLSEKIQTQSSLQYRFVNHWITDQPLLKEDIDFQHMIEQLSQTYYSGGSKRKLKNKENF